MLLSFPLSDFWHWCMCRLPACWSFCGRLFCVYTCRYNMATGNAEDRSLFKKFEFHYAVFDEGHLLKNMSSQRYQGLMRIAVSLFFVWLLLLFDWHGSISSLHPKCLCTWWFSVQAMYIQLIEFFLNHHQTEFIKQTVPSLNLDRRVHCHFPGYSLDTGQPATYSLVRLCECAGWSVCTLLAYSCRLAIWSYRVTVDVSGPASTVVDWYTTTEQPGRAYVSTVLCHARHVYRKDGTAEEGFHHYICMSSSHFYLTMKQLIDAVHHK